MSRGSSPTSSVRVTRAGFDETSTMLIESETWFTTQSSPSLRSATETGSMPTRTDPTLVRPAPETAKISTRLSGVLTAYRRVRSDERARGRTWPLSKLKKEAARA